MSRPPLVRATLATVIGLMPAISQGGVVGPVINATKSGTFTPDANNRALPGSAIQYSNTLTNTGSAPALGLTYTDPTPTNTTLVAGSMNVSPVAVNDVYAVVGNTLLQAGGTAGAGPQVYNANGLQANDREFLSDTAVITEVQVLATVTTAVAGTITAATAQGGTVVVTVADGSFTYLPPAGFTGTDGFSYKISDDGTDSTAGNADDLSDTGTVTLNVANRVWYVNAAAGTVGDGRSTSPFDSLADVTGATGADVVGDIIYLHPGNYTGGITLLDNQTLWGANEALVVGGNTLKTAGVDPVISNGSGSGVTLASGNTLKGFTVEDTTAFDIASAASTVGTLTVSNVILSGKGGFVSVTNGGTLNVVLDSATTTEATQAVNLVSASGNFTISAGAISGVTGDDVVIGGGTVTYNHTGTITNTAGRSVYVHSKTSSGNVTFNSKITDSGSGILLDNNDGATVRFDGGLALSTGMNDAFRAVNGGTVIAPDPAGAEVNTITTTTGAALNVTGTTIGTGGLVFRSISSNGGGNNGITLDNTGTTAGLTVTGDGSNAKNGSGGTIQNKTGGDGSTTSGNGIYLNNTLGVSLASMNLTTFDNLGIFGKAVNGFTLRGSIISGTIGANTASNDAAVGFGLTDPGGTNGLFGTSLIDNCEITGSIEHNVEVYQQSGSFTLTISNSNIHDNTMAGGADGIQMEIRGTAVATVNINNNTFDDNKSQAVQISALDNAVVTSNLGTNTVLRSTQGNEGFVLANGGNADLTANITNNSFTGLGGASIFVGQVPGNANTPSDLRATLTGNTITAPATATNHAIIAFLSSTTGQISQARLLIDNNTVTQNSTTGVARGIMVDTPDATRTPNFHATVTNNKVEVNDGATGVAGIVVQARNTATGHFDVRGNDVDFDNGTPGGVFGLRVRQASAGTADLECGIMTTGTAVATVLANNNTLSTTEVQGTVTVVNNSTVLLPSDPLLFAPSREEAAVAEPVPAVAVEAVSEAVVAPALAEVPAVQEKAVLTQEVLDTHVKAAIARWEATGLSADQVAVLRGLRFELSDLPDMHLGSASGSNIRISPRAAGQNWFIDPTPLADGGEPAAGSVDLLTTLMHEMGHALGLPDQYDAKDRDSIMYGFLHQGERRLPAKDAAAGVKPTGDSVSRFLSAPINIGDLPQGKSVTIVYRVTINSNTTATSINSQGTATDTATNSWTTNAVATPVEQPPVLSAVGTSVTEDGTLTFGATSFDSGFSDPNSDLPSTVRITSLPGNGVLKLSGSDITVVPRDILRANLGALTYSPVANSNAADSFGWNATDGVSYAASASVVNISITAVNDAPTLAAISNPAAILEDSGAQTVNLSGITTGGGETQVLTVTASSNNTTLLADPVVTYTSPGGTGSLSYTPVANQSGTAVVTVTVTDDGGTANGGINTVQRTFTVNVTAVNDAPTLAAISDPALLPISSPQQTVNLSGISEGPLETAQTLNITAVSNNPSVIPNPSVSFVEGSATGSLSFTPVAGQSGSALITVTVTDNGGTANSGVDSVQRTFTVNVSEAVSIAATDANADVNGDNGSFTFTRGSSAGELIASFELDSSSTADSDDFTLTGATSFNTTTGEGTVTFANGQASVVVTLVGTAASPAEAEAGETVNLAVVAQAGVYQVGSPANAVVNIAPNGFAVVNTNDSGKGSLRQAVLNANTLAGANTITFEEAVFTDNVADTITLTGGELDLTSEITVAGPGAELLTVSAGGTSRILDITGGGLLLEGVTLSSGNGAGDRSSGQGGAVFHDGNLTLINSVVSDNAASSTGGGIRTTGTALLTVVNSTLSGNTATSGGAIHSSATALVNIANSSVSANSATTGTGGGIANEGGLTILQSTVAANTAATGGGGIANTGIISTLGNTILATNASTTGAADLTLNSGGTVTSASGNVIGTNTGHTITNGVNSNQVGTAATPLDPLVGSLADNGGSTRTHALLAGSPAINSGVAGNVPADTFDLDGDTDVLEPLPFDQRGTGFTRSIGGVDAGSFELQKSISILADAATAAEGSGAGNTAFTFTVSRTGDTTGDVTLDYAVTGAANAADFGGTLPSGVFTLPDTQASAVLTINVSKDSVLEPDEAFTVTLSNASGGYAITTAAASSTITNDDSATVTVAKVNDGAEANTPVNGLFRVTQSAASSTDTVINYTVGGSATSASDYTALSGSVTITAGNTTADIPVPVLNDATVETTETVSVNLTSISAGHPGATLGATVLAALDITDNDTANVVIAKINDGAETNSPTNGLFRVTQSAFSSSDTVVSYTVGGSAASGNDYTALSGSVTIAAGQTTADISVTVLNDAVVEGTETVSVTLTGFTAGDTEVGLGATVTAALDITDNDAATVVIAKINDGAETNSPTNGLFRVTQSANSSTNTVVTYAVGGTVNASDFTALTGSVTILAGQTTADIPVTVLNDAIVEGTETLAVTLTGFSSGASGVALGAAVEASLDISDDDTATVVIAKINDGAETNSPANGLFRVTQSAASSTNTVVTYTVGGTATSDLDYTVLTGSVTITAGQTTADIPVVVVNEARVEATETVSVTLTGFTARDADISLGTTVSANLDITDNDTGNVVIEQVNNGMETGLPANANFRVIQNAMSSSDTVVTYTVGGTATNGSDYTTLTGSVTIPAGSMTVTIPVEVLNDSIVEELETVSLTLTGFTARDPDISLGATLTASAVISDDDVAAVTIAKINDGAETNSPSNGLFRVTQSASSSTDTVVSYSTGGSAASGSDYTALTGTVTIAAGQTTADINVAVLNDTTVEGTETVIVTLTGFTAGDTGIALGATATATANITDNDTANVVIAKINDGAETNAPTNGLFRVTQSAISSSNTVVSYSIGGSATSGGDYTALTGSVTITAGQTTADIGVAVLNDAIVETTETVSLTLTGFTSGDADIILGTTVAASADITDNDAANIVLAKLNDGAETNSPVNAVFQVTQSAISSSDTILTYTVGGTAVSGSDYTALTGSVTIPSGQVTADIPVPVLNDTTVEGTETVSVTLTGFTARDADVSLSGIVSASATITDDDTATVSVAKLNDGAETNSPAGGAFRVSLSAASSSNTTVNFAVSGSATSGSDFTAPGASVTITAGQTSADVTIPVLNDNFIESTETVVLTLTSVSGNTSIAIAATPNNSASLDITDNDVAASIAVNSGSPQSATVNTAFASPMVAIVRDSGGVALGGASVTFTANGVTANGSFSSSATVLTNGSGLATAPTFTANTVTGSYTVTAATPGVVPTASFALTNTPAAATHFAVVAPANAIAGQAFNVTVTARDAFDNTATGYAGIVRFTSSDSAAILPANTTLASGVGTVSVNLSTGGNQTVTATDTVSSIAGTSNAINVSPRADLRVAISDSPDPVNAAGNLTYTINLTNNGPSAAEIPLFDLPTPASTTYVSLTKPAGWLTITTPSVGGTGTVEVASMAPLASGASATFTVVVKVNLNVVNDSTITGSVTGSTATTDPNPANNSASTTTLAKSGADLQLALTDAPDPVIAGTELTYTMQVQNNGPLDAENVSISDTLPAGTTFVGLIAPAGWSATTPAVGATGTVTITRPLFTNAATASFTLVTKVASNVANGTVLSDTATISSTTIDIAPGNNSATATTTVSTSADLAVQISRNPATAPKGSDVTFTITVTNNGASDAVSAAATFPVPAQMTFVSATQPAGWAASAPAAGGTGNVVFTRPSLATGSTATFTVVAKVNANAPTGTILTGTVTTSAATADPAVGNNTASATAAVGTVAPTAVQPVTTNIPVNSQSGLFDVTVNVTNTTPNPINGFRLHVNYNAYKAAYPSLRLYNASSAANASDVYVDFPYPVAVNAVVAVKLSFYTSTRTFPSPFKPLLTVEILPDSQVPGTNGKGVQPRLVRLENKDVLLEFPSVAGKWYRVRYSADMVNWYDCPVPLQAGSNRMQWIDSGPPFTNVPPSQAPSRFYLVNEIKAP